MSEPIYRSRPGADALAPAAAERAEEVAPGIWCSPGLSNTYLLTTTDGRVVVNTGMGFESQVHRANFDAVDTSPIRYIIVTQGHYDHVGGLDTMRDAQTQVVAQANWRHWRDDNERLLSYRANNSAFAFADKLANGIAAIQQRFGKRLPAQAAHAADVEVDDSLVLTVGGRSIELLATPGGETTDSMVIWLPEERVCLCGNTFGPVFGHIPNFVTMRGDRYRDPLTTIASIERVRALRPEVLITGHFDPIRGAERIHAELTRLRDAIAYLHDRTVEGMNAGKDVHTLMREITLPADLEVGQGYGKVLLGRAGHLGELLRLVPPPLHRRALRHRTRRTQRRFRRPRRCRPHRGTGRGTPRGQASRCTRFISRNPSSVPTRHTRGLGPYSRPLTKTCSPPAPTSGNRPG